MKITSFRFHDQRSQWSLEETELDGFNLLVGVSGVGKTKILQALRRVCRVATESDQNPGPASWQVGFEHDGHAYSWEATTAEVVDDTFPEGGEGTSRSGKQPAPIELVRERVVKDGSLVLVDRSPDAFLLGGTAVPKLKRSASALALFESEAQIKPLRSGFLRVLFSSAAEPPTSILPHYGVASVQERLEEHKRLAAEEGGFVLFREVLAGGGLPTLAKNLSLAGYYFQEAFPALFRRLEDTFIGMFPSVEKVTVRSEAVSSTSVQFELTLNERGVEQAIPQAEMSAGMLRTLVHLLEVTLAPAGSVIVIDEFENSLGMNCMPALTSYLLTRADCQFLLTSHHPYVINNLPIETWKLVRRAGSVVRVLAARHIGALQGSSHHEAFIQLLNLPEFEEAIE